ncbi:MAG: hypothetical protein KF687_13885 [Cyclobacteriaceae bacterium]|nr:hypothetical protein [Cyclobacteriaceae bacterium]
MENSSQTGLSAEQLVSVKKSYFNILGLFLQQESIESRFLRCLLKWGIQLSLHTDDLVRSNLDIDRLTFNEPREKIEALYHLVYLINLDNIVEDVELEVATLYAEKLGFAPELVGELFKSIATAAYDQHNPASFQKEIEDFIRIYKTNS